MARRDDELHPPEVIDEYVRLNYEGLGNHGGISIGLVGGIYRVAVTDLFHVTHTLKINPKEIDAWREAQIKKIARTATAKASADKKLDRARKTAAAFKAKQGRSTDRDRDRER